MQAKAIAIGTGKFVGKFVANVAGLTACLLAVDMAMEKYVYPYQGAGQKGHAGGAYAIRLNRRRLDIYESETVLTNALAHIKQEIKDQPTNPGPLG